MKKNPHDRRGQPNRTEMEWPHPGKMPLLINDFLLSGKYEFQYRPRIALVLKSTGSAREY